MKGYIVIDNFYENPDLIRAQALEADFSKKHPKYPGIDSSLMFNNSEAEEKIKSIIKYDTQRASYSGFFRLSTADEYYKEGHGIHIDKYDIAAIIYLAQPGQNKHVGTSFLKHKASGLTNFYNIKRDPNLNPDWQRLDTQKIMKIIVNDMEKNDATLWDLVEEVEFKYNRAVLMRGNLFHKLSNGFGQNVENGRLTQNFFLNIPRTL